MFGNRVIWLAETVHKHSARMMQIMAGRYLEEDFVGLVIRSVWNRRNGLIMVLSSLVSGIWAGENRLAR